MFLPAEIVDELHAIEGVVRTHHESVQNGEVMRLVIVIGDMQEFTKLEIFFLLEKHGFVSVNRYNQIYRPHLHVGQSEPPICFRFQIEETVEIEAEGTVHTAPDNMQSRPAEESVAA